MCLPVGCQSVVLAWPVTLTSCGTGRPSWSYLMKDATTSCLILVSVKPNLTHTNFFHFTVKFLTRLLLSDSYYLNDLTFICVHPSVIFVNENENKNGEKRENNEFVNEN